MTLHVFLLSLPVAAVVATAIMAVLVRKRRRHEASIWHREQVEMFLHCADDPDYSFKGFEWADYAGASDVEVKVERSPSPTAVSEHAGDFWQARFEPPLARLRCPNGHDEWDVWINEAGEPEDVRDLKCTVCGVPGELLANA